MVCLSTSFMRLIALYHALVHILNLSIACLVVCNTWQFEESHAFFERIPAYSVQRYRSIISIKTARVFSPDIIRHGARCYRYK